MGISATTYSPAKPAGITKRRSTPPRSPPTPTRRNLRSGDKYFWYTAPDGVSRLAVSPDGTVPQQVNDYTFAPSHFAREPYPASLPPGGVWPPRQLTDVLRATGSVCAECVGATCYTGTLCDDANCAHTLAAWKAATADWTTHFELRMTAHRGIGVVTKRFFPRGTVLGWYAGDVKPVGAPGGGDYLMELETGALAPGVPAQGSAHAVYVDAGRRGNWTRFINHCCEPDAVFRIMRVGRTRIMAVQTARDVPAGKELSVDYGTEYYGMATRKRCRCGAATCVERRRARKERSEERRARAKGNVKKCKARPVGFI